MLLDLAENSCPEGARPALVTTADGVRLRSASWRPAGEVRGTVLLLQGRAEWIEKYFETIADFIERGFAVICFDWRGQGGSQRLLPDPMKGHVEYFEDYQNDLDAIIAHYDQDLLQKPVLALAHSMGGMVLLHALERRPALAKAVILTAPMFEIELLRRQSWLKNVIALCCLLGLKRHYPPLHRSQSPLTMVFANNPLTNDRSRFSRNQLTLKARPALAVGMPTLGWLQQAQRAITSVPRLLPRLHQMRLPPLLVFASEEDRVTATPTTRTIVQALASATLVEIDGIGHEVLMEIDTARKQFWNEVERSILPLFAA